MSNAHNISGPEEEDTVLRNSGLCEADQALLSSWFGSTEAPVLFRAVVIGQWALVRKLLNDPKHQVDLGYPDISDYTTLHYAAWDRHVPISILKEMIAISEKNVNNKLTQKVTVKGRTSLHLAAWRGNDDVVIMLANTDRAAASMLDKCSKSALGDACTRNRSSLVLQSIVEADPSQLEVQNKWGRTPPMIFFRISQGWLCERLTGDLDRQSVTVFQEKANILLEAAFQMKHNRKVSSKWELIQSAIESPFCPFEVRN